jgi:hypothetical protein
MFETLLSPSEIKLFGREMPLLHLANADSASDAANKVLLALAALPPNIVLPAGDAIQAILLCLRALTVPDEISIAALLLGVAQQSVTPASNAQSVVDVVKKYVASTDLTSPIAPIGANNFLQAQLDADGARVARIYAFSYEGHYYDLPKPAIFLVHGAGDPLEHGDYGKGQGDRTTLETSGVMAREWEFNATNKHGDDVRRWSYDKGDFSIRMDIETGQFEQILLAAITRGGTGLTSGSDLRTSGSDLRISGSDLRIKR